MTPFDAAFRRPITHVDIRRYEDPVTVRVRGADVDRFVQLYTDCFSHHLEYVITADTSRLIPLPDSRRLVQTDNMTARFLAAHYRPPRIVATASSDSGDRMASEIDLETFVRNLSDSPLLPTATTGGDLGSNRFCYVMGDVGMGKTLLMLKVLSMLHGAPPGADGMRVLPVRLDLDGVARWGRQPEDISDDFFRMLYRSIRTEAMRSPTLAPLAELEAFREDQGTYPRELIARLSRHLVKRGIRLFIVFDNTDRYHFHYSRHVFFDKYHRAQLNKVRENFGRLINAFVNVDELGGLGLCVVLVCREYVFRDFRYRLDASSTTSLDHEAHSVFQLDALSAERAMEPRFELLKEAVGVVEERTSGEGLEYLSRLRMVMMESLQEGKGGYGTLNTIRDLSHHGLRSFVDFVSSIRIDYRNDYEVFARLFKDQPYNLLRLYMSNLKKRFTEDHGHFPNLFLNDGATCREEGFEEAYEPHQPTYWLRYLILKYVVQSRDKVVGLTELQEVFVRTGRFAEKLFLVMLGSLCSVDECWCLEVEYVGKTSFRRLRPTSRGKVLLGSVHDVAAGSTEFCFQFEYLQLVIDDYLLAFPVPWYEHIYVDSDLGYTLKEHSKYGSESWEYLRKKTKATLYFLRVLEASLKWEMRARPEFFELPAIAALTPDFDAIGSSILTTFAKILRAYTHGVAHVRQLEDLWTTLRSDSDFDAFFDDVAAKPTLVAPL